MRLRSLIYLLLILAGAAACMPDEEVLHANAVTLGFSTDTVFFDTLFVSEQSVTKRLRIFNPTKQAVLVSVGLRGGENSPYTLLVNGIKGKAFDEQFLLGGDSLLVLLEARLPVTNATDPYLASDAVQLVNKGYQQEVPVIGYGQNANFFGNEVIACDAIWNSSLPYVIDKTILVEANCTLTLEKGARLYFKPGAYLYVRGTLLAEGDSASHILFRNHRLGAGFESQPGQWGGIVFEKSHGNRMRYCDVRNAELGVVLESPDADDTPDLVLEHCRLENLLYGGILCYNSDLEATNTLVANSVDPAVQNLGGGNYRYTHCTFANYFRSKRELPAALFTDQVSRTNEVITADLNLLVQNTIIWGNIQSGDELEVLLRGNTNGTQRFEHNLIRTRKNDLTGNGNILNAELGFVRFQDTQTNNFRPDSLSPAIGAAKPLGIEHDLSGRKRDEMPDIGALEHFKSN